MKYAFIVIDCGRREPVKGFTNIVFEGIFLTEQEAIDACTTADHMMACLPIGVSSGDKWPFGFRFPLYDKINPSMNYGVNAYRLPDDL